MGSGELGKPDTVFARKYRWTFGGDMLPEHFMKRVLIDYQHK